ncbi:MAG: mechanosensitive ion channel [Enterobacter hormaechei]|nr:mechanosensitive ion channel [Enterobacter hormaechei]
MKKILLAFAFCFAALSAFSSYAAEPRQAPTEQERARTVYIFHQPIVMLQAKFVLTTPEERVLRIRNTLRNFTEADVREPLSIVPVTRYNQQGRLIVMNGKPVMLLTEGDWLFALSAAWPFLPGANSLAFKGISVFFGLMLTLGSAGVMNHAMSGLVLIYSRALHKGDVIRVADNEGKVSEIGMLATKIITRENYVVTVPNAVVVSGKITNLSALQPDGSLNLTVSVTIGYDTPWRQVHAMLELAAKRAKGIDLSEPPLVRQLGLMDWYIAYELQVRLLPEQSLAVARNELHSQIQDVFNEFNVQIMSPNFVMQPEGSVMVAKENWYTAPAKPPQGET